MSLEKKERFNCLATTARAGFTPLGANIFVCCHHGVDFTKLEPMEGQQQYKKLGVEIDINKEYVCPVCGIKHKFIKNTEQTHTIIHIE